MPYLPTKMSQFENVTALSTSSYIIGLDIYAGNLSNIKISGSAAGYELARKRWILNPPVTSSNDPRGDDGAESYNLGEYWVKSGSAWVQLIITGSDSGGTISSSYQLSDGGGNAFDNSNNVTFGSVNALNITSSNNLSVYANASLGTNYENKHFVSGSMFISGSTHVSGNAYFNGIEVVLQAANVGDGLYFKNGNTTAMAITRANSRMNFNLGTPAANGFTFGTVSNASALLISDSGIITTTGNIGIGKTGNVANARLDVNGNSIITGSLIVTNGITGSFSGTASYALVARSNNVYNVKDFGAVGDDNQNDTSAILLAISASQASRIGTVYFPDGIYVITGSLRLPSDPQCDIALLGNGSNVSVIKQIANVNGIEFNMDNGGTDDQKYQVAIKGLGLKTVGQASGSIYITYGNSSISSHTDISVDLDDVHILSSDVNYWTAGIVLESAWNYRISNTMVIGQNIGTPFSFNGTGLEIRRMCVNGTIHNSQFNFWNTGIHINTVDYSPAGQNTEGLLISQVYMVPVNYGVRAIGNRCFLGVPGYDWAGRPYAGRIALLSMNNSHIDCRSSGSALYLENVQGHFITSNLFIADGTGSGVYGKNAHEGAFIGNTFFNAGSAPSVYIGGYSGSANIVTGNIFRGGSTHVLLESSSIYNKVYGNVAYDALSINLSNLGTNNLTGSVGY